ncbi:MAG: transposase [Paracoccaceae bacterium]|nr:transposase [Paracoccaceae bacterium]
MVPHTWGQNLGRHIHVHCIVTDGGLSPDQDRWFAPTRKGFLFPTRALSKVFRGKVLDFLAAARRKGGLRSDRVDDDQTFERLTAALRSRDQVIYAKAPFANTGQVLGTLGRYTLKTAITNRRLVDFDGESVRFRWRDYAHGNTVKVMRLGTGEIVRRFLLHVLPKGFTRIRHCGLLANRFRARKLARCRALIGQPDPEPFEPESGPAMMLRLTGKDITVCEQCGHGPLRQTSIPGTPPETVWQAARPRPP